MGQVSTTSTKLKSVIHSHAFNVGYNEVLNSIPYQYDKYEGNTDDAWNYERGRQFAHCYKGKVKNGRKVSFDAIIELGDAVDKKYVI